MYLAVSIATRAANAEPWSSVALRTGVLLGISLGCVALSWIQRARVLTIGHLLEDRTDLVGQLMSTEDRERRVLAERLHDGALQYLLGARHDLEDARQRADPEAFARLELALTESSRLLRSTVAELHPAVLEHAGLARALRQLADSAATAGRLAIAVELDGWSDEFRSPVDGLLYAAARELLSNVVKHADATSATVTLSHERGRASLVVADDGRGIDAAGSRAQPRKRPHRPRVVPGADRGGGRHAVSHRRTRLGNDRARRVALHAAERRLAPTHRCRVPRSGEAPWPR